MQHVIKTEDSNEHLLEWILSRDNMQRAWKRVKSNKGASGVDKMTVESFPDYLKSNWTGIRESLMNGSYQPSPVLRVEIPKPSGGVRPLGIPTVLDRMVQQAIAQVLSTIYDSGFSESSYGFRPERSAHDAVYTAREYITRKYKETFARHFTISCTKNSTLFLIAPLTTKKMSKTPYKHLKC